MLILWLTQKQNGSYEFSRLSTKFFKQTFVKQAFVQRFNPNAENRYISPWFVITVRNFSDTFLSKIDFHLLILKQARRKIPLKT